MKTKDFEERLRKEDAFANWLTAIAPYMIDKEVSFSNFYNGCWAFFEDFLKVLTPQKKTEFREAAKTWKSCLMSRDRKISPQLNSVIKCVEKF